MKSQSIDFLVDLFFKVLDDSSHVVSELSLNRDKAYALSRVKEEGLSFLTKVLPRFLKGILSGLETGTYAPVPGFKAIPGGRLPAFLQGWTTRIFQKTGELLPVPDTYAISEVYQILSLLYKLELPCSDAENLSVIYRFIENEADLSAFVLEEDAGVNTARLDLAKRLLSRVLRGIDPRDIRPKHGPGSTATGEEGNRKYLWKRKYQRLHQMYPYYEYFSPSLSAVSFDYIVWYRRLKPELNPVAKVVLVPKDSRGPRLISMEPTEIQWIQQGLARLVTERVESHPLTKGKVNFENQSINRQLALEASKTRHLATVDLKDASDRISLTLVRRIFPEELLPYLEACRSVATKLPSGRVQALRKFAPMGSALCFPVLALTCWALSEATLRLRDRIAGSVHVYGDDLIIPTEHMEPVLEVLHTNGLRINRDKTYSKGFFRESCGMDAYDGIPITPIRMRRCLKGVHPDHSVYCHLIEVAEAFFDKGYWKTCDFLRRHVERNFGPVPWTYSDSCVGFKCPSHSVALERNKNRFKIRWNSELQRTEARVLRVISHRTEHPVTSHVRLLKGLSGLYRMDSEHHQVTLRGECALHRRWCVV